MARQSIEIPDAVFEVEVESKVSDYVRCIRIYVVSIMVGGVTVYSRTYQDDDDLSHRNDYVYDDEDARDRTLRTFGERLRDLLGDD
mgnify:CR=1 FL=1